MVEVMVVHESAQAQADNGAQTAGRDAPTIPGLTLRPRAPSAHSNKGLAQQDAEVDTLKKEAVRLTGLNRQLEDVIAKITGDGNVLLGGRVLAGLRETGERLAKEKERVLEEVERHEKLMETVKQAMDHEFEWEPVDIVHALGQCEDAISANKDRVASLNNRIAQLSDPYDRIASLTVRVGELERAHERVRELEQERELWLEQSRKLTHRVAESEGRAREAFAELSRVLSNLLEDSGSSECHTVQTQLLMLSHLPQVPNVGHSGTPQRGLTAGDLQAHSEAVVRAGLNLDLDLDLGLDLVHRDDDDASSMASSIAPPTTGRLASLWMPNEMSDDCTLCDRRFSLFVRRHHCRNCGRLVCNACALGRSGVEGMPGDSWRVCDRCLEEEPALLRRAKRVPDRLRKQQQALLAPPK